jgi:glycosyltransferase involved in cell wall biosynthesis
MHILIATTRYQPDFAGGAERRFHAMARAALGLGHAVEVITTRAFKDLPSGSFEGIPVVRLDWPPDQDSSGFWAVECFDRIFRRENHPDLMWTGNAAMALAAVRVWPDTPILFCPGEMKPLGRLPRLKRAVHRWRENGWAFSRVWWRREAVVKEVALSSCTTALPSALILNWIASDRPEKWPSLRVIPRGVEVARWAPAREFRRPSPAGSLRVLIACRLESIKNVEHAIEAVRRCRNGRAILQICGSGPHEPNLRQRVASLHLQDQVKFCGLQEDMIPVYAGADALVVSSHCDMFPNTVLEALAAGCPVIMRRPDPPRVIIGNYEIVAQSPGCLTYGTDDIDELAGAFSLLAENPVKREAMSRAAAEWADQFDWTRMIHLYMPSRPRPQVEPEPASANLVKSSH